MEIELKIKQETKSKITIRENLDIESEIKKLGYDKSVIITDRNIRKVLGNKIRFGNILEIEPNKKKELYEFKRIINFFLENNITRKSIVVGIGGGKISDITGFSASVYLRGIRWVSVPTTVLSQIDASIGGKTALDFKAKNIIGSFHNPSAVLIDPLISISRKENINESTGELIKYALISDRKTSSKIIKLLPFIIKHNYKAIKQAIELSAVYKIKIVSKDPFDEKGIREILNFGHTAGHAIEHIYKIPHGNAVTIGINFAIKLSSEINLLSKKNYEKMIKILRYDEFKLKLKKTDFKHFLFLISKDKKNKGYNNYFILINDKMELKGFKDIDIKKIKKIWEEICQEYS